MANRHYSNRWQSSNISTRPIPIRRYCRAIRAAAPACADWLKSSPVILHPLIVPRVREYLEHDFKFDQAAVHKWCQHWHVAAITALEMHLSDKATGRYCHGDTITLADICLASQAAGAKYYDVDTAPFPNFRRIVNELSTIDAFARAHPAKQPGAPAG